MVKLTPQKLTNHQKQLADPSSRYWQKKCDRIWSKMIRAVGQCAICGESNPQKLDAHHIIPRQIKPYRHHLNNGICLCKSHHRYSFVISAHQASAMFYVWLRQNRPDQFDWLCHQNITREMVKAKIDYKATLDKLRQ